MGKKDHKLLIKETIGVSFNVADPWQKGLYEYVKSQTNMSGYLKRLIDNDMKGVPSVPAPLNEPEPIDADTANMFI